MLKSNFSSEICDFESECVNRVYACVELCEMLFMYEN